MKKITNPQPIKTFENCFYNIKEDETMNSVFNSVPPIIKNDASQAFASFLFAEGKDLFSESKGQSVDVPQPMPEDKDQPLDVNDEQAQSASGPVATDTRSLVNDDLAACVAIASQVNKSTYLFSYDLIHFFKSIFLLLNKQVNPLLLSSLTGR